MIKLKSVYKTQFWGGTKIRDVLHKDVGELSRVAESWELSTHPNGKSVIVGGEYDGKTLNEYFDAVGWAQVGEYATRKHRLPIMIKYIDARENLSIQVHPTEKYAAKHNNDGGKNEIWFVLDADENACLYLGFNKDVTKAEVLSAIENKTIARLLNRIPVKKGEVYYIPAGTVHAIGAGCLICELQQTSDATYRLYDYDRTDENGKLRPLHLKDGLAVLNLKKLTLPQRRQNSSIRNMLGEVGKLTFSEYNAEGEATYLFPDAKFVATLILEGEGAVETVSETPVKQGETYIITESFLKLRGNCRALIVSY